MILSLIWSFSRNRFQNDENLFNIPIFELYIFTNIWIPEEEIFETVPRTVVKLLYRQLRAGNYVFVGRARRMVVSRDSEIDPGGEITDRITIRGTKRRE